MNAIITTTKHTKPLPNKGVESSKPENVITERFEIFFESSKRKTVDKIFITIAGEFTVANITAISRTLVPVKDKYRDLAIKLENIRRIDLSAVQLLYALSSTHGQVSIKANLDTDQRKLLGIAGFSDLVQQV